MNTTISNDANKIRELSDAMGATEFVDHGHVCYFSKGREWSLYANYGHKPTHYTIGVHIPSSVSYDVRSSYYLREMLPPSINLAKTKTVEALANAIHRRLFPAAVEFSKALWKAVDEEANYKKKTIDTTTQAAKLIGASVRPNSTTLYGKIGNQNCSLDIYAERINLKLDNLNITQLTKIANALKE